MRRAIDGPQAMSQASVDSAGASIVSLSDDQILGFIADATANVIILTGGSPSFGYQLEVTSRDPYYLAPNGWQTNAVMNIEAETTVIAQGAIDFFFQKLADMKVSETIRDEGQEWDWEKSAALVRDQLKLLAAVRDRALENLRLMNQQLDSYISFVAERDKLAAIWIEPWVAEIGASTPFVSAGDISSADSRFLGPGEAWW